MSKEKLLEMAGAIQQPSPASAEAYAAIRASLPAKINQVLEARPDISRLVGNEENISMMRDNHNNHTVFMETLFRTYSAEALVDTMFWVLDAYKNHGFQSAYWSAQLSAWEQILEQELPADAWNEIRPVYDFLISQQAVFQSSASA